MTSNTSADMGNAPTGTYVFKRKVTYGSCVSETTYTMVLKYCTREIKSLQIKQVVN